jgi:predicted RNase H-like nuclease (RuvC/YqgF family)
MCRNLQKQLESQKRRSNLEIEGSSQKYEKQLTICRCRIEELSMDVAQKDMMVGELKIQLDQMV